MSFLDKLTQKLYDQSTRGWLGQRMNDIVGDDYQKHLFNTTATGGIPFLGYGQDYRDAENAGESGWGRVGENAGKSAAILAAIFGGSALAGGGSGSAAGGGGAGTGVGTGSGIGAENGGLMIDNGASAGGGGFNWQRIMSGLNTGGMGGGGGGQSQQYPMPQRQTYGEPNRAVPGQNYRVQGAAPAAYHLLAAQRKPSETQSIVTMLQGLNNPYGR